MSIKDETSLLLASDQQEVDLLNSKFYSRFNYPWYPQEFSFYEDNDFWRRGLCQDIGNWALNRMPEKMKVWVAGCGTNQAIFTALRYPDAEVTGTDLSPKSIEVCQRMCEQLGIRNLKLNLQSLNESSYEDEFDYIICTGVIHHNANPEITFKNLAKALKRNGVMELMVYNYYHRILTTAYQKAIHTILHADRKMDAERESSVTKQLMLNFPVQNLMKNFLVSLQGQEESMIADSLIQPVEHSYTVGSLNALGQACGLEILSHCINKFDVTENRLSWNMDLRIDSYQHLPDIERWQVGNLLMLDRSPMLWFYLQRKDSDHIRQSEAEICEFFIGTKFKRNETKKFRYEMVSYGRYEKVAGHLNFPIPRSPAHGGALKVYNLLDPRLTIRDIMKRLGLDTSFRTVNELRINLSTTAFPYLTAVI